MSVTLFERRFRNSFEDLGRVSLEAGRFLEAEGINDRPAYVTNLTIEELLTNILKYGYDDAAEHEIFLRVSIRPALIEIEVEDDGHRFNPWEFPEPDTTIPPEERAPGGLGIHMIRKLASRVDYQRSGALNRVTVEVSR